MEFANVKAFAEMSKDLYDAMKAFSLNYNNERKGLKAFEAHSKEEMKTLINKAFANEVAKQSGIALPNFENKTEVKRYAMNPMVKFYANQIQDVLIDMILPETLLTGSLKYILNLVSVKLNHRVHSITLNLCLILKIRKGNTTLLCNFICKSLVNKSLHLFLRVRFKSL